MLFEQSNSLSTVKWRFLLTPKLEQYSIVRRDERKVTSKASEATR